jgi:hypothetical protein
MSSAWVPAVVTCLVPLGLLLLSKAVPCYGADDVAEAPFIVMKCRYAKWERFEYLAALVLIAVFTWVIGQCLIDWQTSILPPVGKDEFRQAIPAECWYCVAFCLAIVCAALPMHTLYAILLGERYKEYRRYGNLKIGYDAARAFRWIAAVIVLTSAALIGLGMDCYAVLDSRKLTTNGFLSFEAREHPYSDLRELRQVAKARGSKGGIIERPYVELQFNDGFLWSSRVLESRTDDPKLVERMLQFVSDHSGSAIVHYDFSPGAR